MGNTFSVPFHCDVVSCWHAVRSTAIIKHRMCYFCAGSIVNKPLLICVLHVCVIRIVIIQQYSNSKNLCVFNAMLHVCVSIKLGTNVGIDFCFLFFGDVRAAIGSHKDILASVTEK